MRLYSLVLTLVATGLLLGCGGSNTADVLIQPVGNQIAYEQTSFTVQAGQTVNLTFENLATSPAMVHNVVILNTNDDAVVERVGMAGQMAADTNYIPDDQAVMAYTEIAQPGESKTVTFTAPTTPGTYRYICTFPGHYMLMQGTMIVE